MTNPQPWRLAACQYPIDFLADFDAYAAKLSRLVREAVEADAQLLLFPEYGAMELASLLPEDVRDDLRRQITALQTILPDFLALHRELAHYHAIYLAAASIPVAVRSGRFHNRVHLFAPDGAEAFQDKLTMTRFEAERWGIAPGREVKTFETALGRIAIDVCYDVEFPLIARSQVEAGAELILVPSCTDGLAGYSRVRIGAQARALENQCLVAMSPTVGDAPWSPAVDANVGAAGLFGPPDRGLPSDGVLAMGEMNAPGWVYAEIDLMALATLRADPEVRNREDWPKQEGVKVSVERL